MKLLTLVLAATFSAPSLAAPITYLFEGESVNLVRGSPIAVAVTFDLTDVDDSDPSNTRDNFGSQPGDGQWLASFFVEYSGLLGDSSFAGSDAGITLVDEDTDRFRLFSSTPFDPFERFTQGIEINLSGTDLFAPGSGGLSGSLFDVAQFLDSVSIDALMPVPGTAQGLYRDGSGGNLTFSINSITRLANSVPEPLSIALLIGLMGLLLVRTRGAQSSAVTLAYEGSLPRHAEGS